MGCITRPHGVRGEVCVDWYADDPSFLAGKMQLEFTGGRTLELEVKSVRPHKNGLLVFFVGMDSRDAVEGLRGATLWIPRSRLPELPEGEAYLDDLLGRSVTLADGTVVGSLHHIEMPAGQMVWALRDGTWEILFPAHPEFIVSLHDPIVIDPPEGLLEACRTRL